jgi:hypothetical protein
MYKTKFENPMENSIKLYEDCYGTREMIIPPGETVLEFQNKKDAIWPQYNKVKVQPIIVERDEVMMNGSKIKVRAVDGFNLKLSKRKSFKEPFDKHDWVTMFYNSDSPIFREFYGLQNQKIYMPRGVKVYVAMDIFEFHVRYSEIIIAPPVPERRKNSYGEWVTKYRQNLQFVLRSDKDLEKIKKDKDELSKRRAV